MDGAAIPSNEHEINNLSILTAPKPRLSQKQIHKYAKENTYKFSGEINICDLIFDENYSEIQDISIDFSIIKRKRSINA